MQYQFSFQDELKSKNTISVQIKMMTKIERKIMVTCRISKNKNIEKYEEA